MLITRRLKEALALIDVRVLDHLIVAESVYSFAEAGFLQDVARCSELALIPQLRTQPLDIWAVRRPLVPLRV